MVLAPERNPLQNYGTFRHANRHITENLIFMRLKSKASAAQTIQYPLLDVTLQASGTILLCLNYIVVLARSAKVVYRQQIKTRFNYFGICALDLLYNEYLLHFPLKPGKTVKTLLANNVISNKIKLKVILFMPSRW